MKIFKSIQKKSHFRILLFAFFWLTALAVGHAQTSIGGSVTDEAGQPLAGANVLVKGTTNGTQTDFDGNFTISANTDATLVFSYLGFTTKEIAVAGQSTVNVSLTEDASQLDEVVVIGYGTQRKSDLTGAISSVQSEDIAEIAVVTVGQALQGRAAGVTVTANSGAPGSNAQIRIRGIGTVNNSDPYVIVDGVPGSLNNLNSADIQNIEVLKDASATAIYGSNGANGVILVTTKSGRKGKVTVNVSSSIGTQQRARDLDMLGAQDWARLVNEGSVNDGEAPLFTDQEVGAMQTYDWGNLIFQSGFIQNNQVSVSGGSDFATYFVSYGYTNQDGILKESAFDRHNLRVNNEYQLNKNIKLGHRISYTVSNQQTRREGGEWLWSQSAIQGYGWEPYIPFYDANGGYSEPQLVSAIHPDAEVLYETNDTKNRSFGANIYLDVNFLKDFNFRTTYAPGFSTSERYDFDPVIDPDGLGYSVAGGIARPQNQLESRSNRSSSYTWSNVLTYNKEFGKKHNLTVLLGHEQQEFSGINTSAIAQNISDLFEFPAVKNGNSTLGTGDRFESSLFSLFSRLIYNYDDRYLVTGTVRRDGSSKFGPDSRYGVFPAGSVAWNVHNEGFMESVDFFNQFKIRGGIGEIGNRSINDFAFFSKLSLGPTEGVDVVFNGARASGAASKGVSNPGLKWESTTTTNIGVDLGFAKNFTLSFDYFDRQTKDMILLVPPPTQSSGLTAPTLFNVGEMSNKGWELALGYNKQWGDFGVSLNGYVDSIKNELTKLDRENGFIAVGQAFGANDFLRSEVGESLSFFYGLETDGIYQTQAEVDSGPADTTNPQPGDIRFKDQNGDNVIDADDRTKIGSPFPDFNYSFNFEFNYKDFDLTLFLQGTEGNEIFSSLPYFFESELGSGLQTRALDRWTGPGTSNTLPRVTFTGNARNIQISDRYVFDGSYLRVKNLQLGYNFPDSILDRLGIERLRLYISGQNLHTFTKYDIGFDPEVGTSPGEFGQNNSLIFGLDRGGYPQPRTYLFGINLTL